VEYYLETDNEKFNGRSENSYQLLFSAAGAYNNTVGDGNTYDFAWDSNVEYVTVLEEGTTINKSSDDAGWHIETRLPWEDIEVDGRQVKGQTMGWNFLVADYPGGTAISWWDDVDGFNNNHDCSAWGEITFDEGYVCVEPGGKLSTTWGTIKSGY